MGVLPRMALRCLLHHPHAGSSIPMTPPQAISGKPEIAWGGESASPCNELGFNSDVWVCQPLRGWVGPDRGDQASCPSASTRISRLPAWLAGPTMPSRSIRSISDAARL